MLCAGRASSAGRPLYCSGRRSIMTFSTFSFSTIEHDRNYVFGDSLVRDEALPHSESPALQFQVRATAGRARAAQMQLPHFLCETPMFMPVGTQGVQLLYRWHSNRCSICQSLSRPTRHPILGASTQQGASHLLVPVGTVKGLTVEQLERAKAHLILGNTYHLGNRPGADAVQQLGGLHKFSSWKRAMLTDSGDVSLPLIAVR